MANVDLRALIKLLGVLLVLPLVADAGNATEKACPVKLRETVKSEGVKAVLEKHDTALLMLLGFGGFSVILALIHNAVRKYVFHDEHNLDTTFDAGGNVSLSLTAVTVASQLFWPGDILHSATLATKNGIAGPFWYAVGIMANIFVFPMLSVQFKTRAPGAKTYLQIIHARFGSSAHKVFCVFALLTNLVITIGIILAGQAVIQSLTKNTSDEFTVLIMATLFGSYSLIGGLGTTFYVSYFNACLVFILLIVFVVKILHNSESQYDSVGNVEKMYEAVSCIKASDDTEYGYLSFRSMSAFLYGIIEVFVSSAVTYCDQASWQSRIAAKPVQGVWGFILAGFMWFSIPSTMATTTGMAYLAISSTNGSHMLLPGEIDEGLVTPLIAEKILGSAGGILVLTMGAMALMSTGSGEVMAISSIIVYDIYQTYINPFRYHLKSVHCILCGRVKREAVTQQNNDEGDFCACVDATRCHHCVTDLQKYSSKKSYSATEGYKCPTHGKYREYQDYLINFKNMCIVWVTIGIIPLGLVVFESGMDLNWIFYSGAIATIPCFPPVLLSILWVKATGKGLIAGSICGLVCGISATLIAASFYEGGLNKFLLNTVQDYAILAGTSSSFGVSLIVCILGSLMTHKITSSEDESHEWYKMYDIDNPLNPWELNYREDLKGYEYQGRPSFDQMFSAFKSAKTTAYIAGSCAIALFALVIPCIMASFPNMDFTQFSMWVTFTQIWAIVMAIIVIIAPPAEEISRIVKQCRKNKGMDTQVIKSPIPECNELIVKDNNIVGNSDQPTHV
ncbi:urea-proton symporter DUR3-like [Haliotis rubra]|uniref:urea-proton symporter DUR3-like n=1 Tax=Haliotis rubra TaxID=36100 RepID=UPI001EE52242|nr:urea-proton symporter DUR3-like [Haliotis rubra]